MTAPYQPYQPPSYSGTQNAGQGYQFAGGNGSNTPRQSQVASPYGTPTSQGLTLASNPANPSSTYANTTPTWSPSSSGQSGNYLNQTIAPGAMTDPVAIANQSWNTFAQSTEPQYQADLRAATQQAAGAGQLGSGMLRSSLGDVANQRNLQLATAQQSLLQNAETQANTNAYQNIGIAQQQQQFQAQQQQTAYAQALSNAQQRLATTLGVGQLGVQQGQLSLANTAQQQQNALSAGELTGNYNGQTTLGAQQLGLQSALGLGQLGVAQQQANTQQAGTLGGLSLGQQQLGQQASQFGQNLALQSQLGLGSLGVQQQQANTQTAAEQAQAAYQSGQLGLGQGQLSLAQQQNQQQFGLAQGELTGNYNGQQTLGGQQLSLAQAQNAEQYGLQSQAQNIQQQQFGSSQAQALQLAQMQDATANRGVDVNYQLANQELMLRAALAGYGGAASGVSGSGVSGGGIGSGGVSGYGYQGPPSLTGSGFVDQSNNNASPYSAYNPNAANQLSNQQFFAQNAAQQQQLQLSRIAQATGQSLYPTLQNGQTVWMLGPAQTANGGASNYGQPASLPTQNALGPIPTWGPEAPPRTATAQDLAGWTFANAKGQPVQISDPSQVMMYQNQYGAWMPEPNSLFAQGNFTATPPAGFSATNGH